MQLMGKAKGHDKAYKPTCDDVAECLEKGPGKRAYEGFECGQNSKAAERSDASEQKAGE